MSALGQVCDEKFSDVSPSFGALTRTLEEVRQTVSILLQQKRQLEPDEPVAAPDSEPFVEEVSHRTGEPEPSGIHATATATAPARAPVRHAGALSAEPADRDDAIARVLVAAKFLRQQDPCSPAPFLMLRGLRWGELHAAGSTIEP